MAEVVGINGEVWDPRTDELGRRESARNGRGSMYPFRLDLGEWDSARTLLGDWLSMLRFVRSLPDWQFAIR